MQPVAQPVFWKVNRHFSIRISVTKRPTISDVKRLAEVSKSTVSHVLNSTRNVEDARASAC